MAIERVPETYRTSDGREFADPQDAEQHQALLAAEDALKAAQHEYEKLLGATHRSADGEPYTFKRSRWFLIAHDHTGRPQLRELDLWPGHVTLHVDATTGHLELRHETFRGDGRPYETFLFSDLYASERACLAAAEQEFVRWLGWQQDEWLKLRARLAEMGS